MTRALLIYPSEADVSRKDLQDENSQLERMYPSGADRAFCRQDSIVALKQKLMETAYDDVVLAYPSVTGDFPEVQMVRSLAIHSRLVIYCPDVSFISKSREVREKNENSDFAQWYLMGASLLCNTCRGADVIIARSDEDRELLREYIPKTPVLTRAECAGRLGDHSRRDPGLVSIIMLTFNQRDLTRQCIESLQHYTPLPHELIIVDNGSIDGTRDYLNDLAAGTKNVRVVFNDYNAGFAKANNQGAKYATGEYILLLNNDVILTEGWLERLIACAESDTAIGVVGPVTNKAVGQQVISVTLPVENAEIQKFACMQLMKATGNWFETHRIIGFCMLIKKEVVERTGLLDERFGPGGFEDYDFCLRVKQAGYRIMIAEDVFIYHIGGLGYTQNNLDYDKLRTQNVQIFIDKWCRRALEILETM